MKYAKGRKALGRCQRCGDKVKHAALQSDGKTKGLRVCGACYDIYPPQWKPFNTDEGIILKKPSPDTDDDSPGASGASIATALGFTNSFGGGT